jgi:hypothetical protein
VCGDWNASNDKAACRHVRPAQGREAKEGKAESKAKRRECDANHVIVSHSKAKRGRDCDWVEWSGFEMGIVQTLVGWCVPGCVPDADLAFLPTVQPPRLVRLSSSSLLRRFWFL